MVKGSLQIIKCLQVKGVFLLHCEIAPFTVKSDIAYFEQTCNYSRELILINPEKQQEKFKLVFPVIHYTPIYNLSLERLEI